MLSCLRVKRPQWIKPKQTDESIVEDGNKEIQSSAFLEGYCKTQ